jgi:hypothetical protein
VAAKENIAGTAVYASPVQSRRCSDGGTWGRGSVGRLRQNIGGVVVCCIIWSGCPHNGTSGPVDFWSCLGQPFEARNNRVSCIRGDCREVRGRMWMFKGASHHEFNIRILTRCPRDGMGGPEKFWSCFGKPKKVQNSGRHCIKGGNKEACRHMRKQQNSKWRVRMARSSAVL